MPFCICEIALWNIALAHYNDVTMSVIASQITSLTIVYSTVYSGADKKNRSSASLAFVWGIHRDRWIPRTKGQLRGKCLHFMTSSCDGVALGNRSCEFCSENVLEDEYHFICSCDLYDDLRGSLYDNIIRLYPQSQDLTSMRSWCI